MVICHYRAVDNSSCIFVAGGSCSTFLRFRQVNARYYSLVVLARITIESMIDRLQGGGTTSRPFFSIR